MLRRGRRTNLRWGVLEWVSGLWTGRCVWTVRRHAARIQDATIFFPGSVRDRDGSWRAHACVDMRDEMACV